MFVYQFDYYVTGMHSPGEPIITSASPGDPYSIGNVNAFEVTLYLK